MDITQTIALTMGVAWASGINLYAAIVMLGYLGSTGSCWANVFEASLGSGQCWTRWRGIGALGRAVFNVSHSVPGGVGVGGSKCQPRKRVARRLGRRANQKWHMPRYVRTD